MNDLRSQYNFNSVEMIWDEKSVIFTLQDIDHTYMTIDSLKSYSHKIDRYLRNKFSKIDSLEIRKYLFSGGGGFEIVEFSVNQKGDIKIVKEY